jgi:hypothetical protein
LQNERGGRMVIKYRCYNKGKKRNMVRFKKKKITNIIRKGKHQEGVNIVKVIKSAKVKVFSNDYI